MPPIGRGAFVCDETGGLFVIREDLLLRICAQQDHQPGKRDAVLSDRGLMDQDVATSTPLCLSITERHAHSGG